MSKEKKTIMTFCLISCTRYFCFELWIFGCNSRQLNAQRVSTVKVLANLLFIWVQTNALLYWPIRIAHERPKCWKENSFTRYQTKRHTFLEIRWLSISIQLDDNSSEQLYTVEISFWMVCILRKASSSYNVIQFFFFQVCNVSLHVTVCIVQNYRMRANKASYVQ